VKRPPPIRWRRIAPVAALLVVGAWFALRSELPIAPVTTTRAPLPAPATGAAADPTTLVLPLSGGGPADAVRWEFRCDWGRGCGAGWSTIPVPSNWELEGFGTYDYGLVREKHRDVGHYRRRFEVPAAWRGRRVELVVGGAMTDVEVRVNGRPAGPAHRGGFTEFRRDLSGLLEYGGANLLEIDVRETSSDRSVERAERAADYWTFGGIYRPVALESRPPESIARLGIDARADGALAAVVDFDSVAPGARLVAVVTDLEGHEISARFEAPAAGGRVDLRGRVATPRPWSDEHPELYRLTVELRRGDALLHRVSTRFGFRTVEIRPGEGLFVNGVRRLLRGVDRHVFRPASGRALDPSASRADAELLRALHLNAVRTAHYPPEPAFLEACDELGIYVLDELPGWHDAYTDEAGAPLVREMVVRDANHPSVVLWANGNEGGTNPRLDSVFAASDPQRRPVLHPDAMAAGVDTHHYPDFEELEARLDPGSLRSRWRGLVGEIPLFLPTEALHALYDGGGGAGLDRYWEAVRRSPLGAGLFLWSFADESVVRTDRGGALDSDGNHAPDGLLGPNGEPSGASEAVRALFAPVRFFDVDLARGEIVVENRLAETNLDALSFRWELRSVPDLGDIDGSESILTAGSSPGPNVDAGALGRLRPELPQTWRTADLLSIAAFDGGGRELGRAVFPIRPRTNGQRQRLLEGKEEPTVERSGGSLLLGDEQAWAELDPSSGRLMELGAADSRLELAGPDCLARPLLPAREAPLVDTNGVRVTTTDASTPLQWSLSSDGWLDLTWRCPDAVPARDLSGIAFDLAADSIRELRFVGDGPGRIWGNRRAGPDFGFWRKLRGTESSFGALGDLPGFYSGVRRAALELPRGTLEIAIGDDDVALGISAPRFPADAGRATAELPPRDSLSFVDRVPPIGSKFHTPAELGWEPPAVEARERTIRLRWRPRRDG